MSPGATPLPQCTGPQVTPRSQAYRFPLSAEAGTLRHSPDHNRSVGEFCTEIDLQQTSTPSHRLSASQNCNMSSNIRDLVASPVNQVSFTDDTAPGSQVNNTNNISDLGPSISLIICPDSPSCHSCTNLQVALNERAHVIADLKKRVIDLEKNLVRRPKSSQETEIFSDKKLLRVRASSLVTGRIISPHLCKKLVLDIYDNEPVMSFDVDYIRAINDRRQCRDAQSLAKWAVFELFSLEEMIGRNCLGGGSSGGTGPKQPFDEHKMKIVKEAIFALYPTATEVAKKAVWMKCVEKINTDVRYLLKTSLKKHDWLQIGL